MIDFDAHLAPYAAHSSKSRGRRFVESPAGARSEFQRDRDRIIHSTAFRRLEYKTQVFLNHEGDLFRTRLTHSIEVAQIARTLARSQDVLNECMKDYGGFEHNLQSLRVVDHLEEHYGAFDGLNLSFETREGILKHCSLTNARQLGELGQRFIDKHQPSLEAQLTNLADEIAYNNHDIDDGLRSGLLTMKQMEEVDLFARLHRQVVDQYPGLPGRRELYETIRLMITAMTADLVQASTALILDAGLTSIDEVRKSPPLIRFSPKMREETTALKRFLYANLYRHYKVNRMRVKASRIVRELFEAFMADPVLLPFDYQVAGGDVMKQARKIADYIAGMTDRYAIREHKRIFSLDEL
jgi:dGTPase